MARVASYNITCPKCSRMLEADLHESVDLQEEPELREELMQNQLNQVTCEECESTFRIDKPLFYKDADQGIYIYWLPWDLNEPDEAEQYFQESLRSASSDLPEEIALPEIHLVLDYSELIERIFICEAERSVRIIEYIKYMIYSKNMDKLKPREKRLLFNTEDSNANGLAFVVQNLESKELETVIRYDQQAYEGLQEMFDEEDETANLFELFPGPYVSARRLFLEDEAD